MLSGCSDGASTDLFLCNINDTLKQKRRHAAQLENSEKDGTCRKPIFFFPVWWTLKGTKLQGSFQVQDIGFDGGEQGGAVHGQITGAGEKCETGFVG